jgi:hypothetical protein
MLGVTLIAEDGSLDHQRLMQVANRLFPGWDCDWDENGFVLRSHQRFVRVVSFGEQGERVFYEAGELDALPLRAPRFAPVYYREPDDGAIFLTEILDLWPELWVDNDTVLASGAEYQKSMRLDPGWDLVGPLPANHV